MLQNIFCMSHDCNPQIIILYTRPSDQDGEKISSNPFGAARTRRCALLAANLRSVLALNVDREDEKGLLVAGAAFQGALENYKPLGPRISSGVCG
jgi:hypothetical protein